MANCFICSEKAEIKIKEIGLYECKYCGLLFKDINLINYEELDENYYNMFNYNRHNEFKQFEKIIYKFCPQRKKLKIIEIGCGGGALLSEFKNAGFDVYGVEPSVNACNIAKEKFNLENVIEGYFNSNLFNFSPDIILLTDVLEHLRNPLELFKEIKKVMSSDTIFIIKSGNPKSITAKLYSSKWNYFKLEQHIAFYSKHTLSNLCNLAGLEQNKYYQFINYFGGIIIKDYFKNIFKAMMLHFLKTSYIKNRFGIASINDHFISVIKIKDAI